MKFFVFFFVRILNFSNRKMREIVELLNIRTVRRAVVQTRKQKKTKKQKNLHLELKDWTFKAIHGEYSIVSLLLPLLLSPSPYFTFSWLLYNGQEWRKKIISQYCGRDLCTPELVRHSETCLMLSRTCHIVWIMRN